MIQLQTKEESLESLKCDMRELRAITTTQYNDVKSEIQELNRQLAQILKRDLEILEK